MKYFILFLLSVATAAVFAKECAEEDYIEAFKKNFNGSHLSNVQGTITAPPTSDTGDLYLTFTQKEKGKDVPYMGFTSIKKSDCSLVASWTKRMKDMDLNKPPRAFGCHLNDQGHGCTARNVDKICEGCNLGMEENDSLLRVDELEINSMDSMGRALQRLAQVKFKEVTVLRKGKELTLRRGN